MAFVPICRFHHDHVASYVCCHHKRSMCSDCANDKDLCDDDCPLINVCGNNAATLSLNARVVILNDFVHANLEDTEKRMNENAELKERLVKKARDHYKALALAMEKSTDEMIEKFLKDFSERIEKKLTERNKVLHDAQDDMNKLLDTLASTSEDEMKPDRKERVHKMLIKDNEQVIGSIDHSVVNWYFNDDSAYTNIVSNKPIGFFHDEVTYEEVVPISNPKESSSPGKRHVTEGLGKDNKKNGKDATKKTATKETTNSASKRSKSKMKSNVSGPSIASGPSSRLPKPPPATTPNREDSSLATKDSNAMKAQLPKPVKDSYFFVQAHADKKSPCAYSIVRKLSDRKILLFDSAHQEFLTVHYNGKVEARGKFTLSFQHLTVMTDNTFAVSMSDGSSIRIFASNQRGNIQEIRKVKLPRRQTRVVGFGFDPSREQFAFVTPENIVLFSSNGDIVDTIDMETYQSRANATAALVDTTNIRGTYNFQEKKVALLHKENRSIQYISAATGLLWKRKFLDEDCPNDVVALGGHIFVQLTTCVVLFSEIGSPIRKYSTADCPEGSRAFCIDQQDGIMVLTSRTSDKSVSRKMFTPETSLP